VHRNARRLAGSGGLLGEARGKGQKAKGKGQKRETAKPSRVLGIKVVMWIHGKKMVKNATTRVLIRSKKGAGGKRIKIAGEPETPRAVCH
jgi:hypothetical protein